MIQSSSSAVLKWVGSKRRQCPRLVEVIKPLLKEGSVYFEPFAGSLAPFFALRQSGWSGLAIVGDTSLPLIRFWEEIASGSEQTWLACKAFLEREQGMSPEERETFYYRCRKAFNSSTLYDKPYRAALFLYLNQRGFNGLYRTNQRGHLTTAYGGPRKSFPSKDTLLLASRMLTNTTLCCADFEELLKRTKPGDVVYADPPYNGTYTGYHGMFRVQEQQRLAKTLKDLYQRGIHIVASNADTEAVRAIYHWAQIETIEVSYAVKGGDRRVLAKEVLISAVTQ